MAATAITRTEDPQTPRRLRIDFLFLDLTSCARCLGASRSLESALGRVGEVLRAAGVEVEVNRVQVESADQARALRFVSSPTIRIDGEDIAFEVRESPCGSEACTDGCGADTACRVWVHQGREYTEPPVELVVDAILRRVYNHGSALQASVAAGYELPDNLGRFFAGRTAAVTPQQGACCP